MDRRAAIVCRGAVALAIVGVFGTWRRAGPVSLDGFEGPHNGWLVIVFALIALVAIGSLSRGGWLGIGTVLGCAAVMIFTAAENVADESDVVGGTSGWGVWLTLASSALLAAVALSAGVARVRGSTRADPRTSP
jgi:hypothetical protein